MATLRTKKALTLEAARRIAAAAEAEALKNGWNVVIAIVDDGGHLIYLQRLDDTQHASVEIATRKAQTAIGFKRPTRSLEEGASQRPGVLTLPALALEGGLPLAADGQMVGAIGVSGVTSQQDGVVAKAGVDALAALLGG